MNYGSYENVTPTLRHSDFKELGFECLYSEAKPDLIVYSITSVDTHLIFERLVHNEYWVIKDGRVTCNKKYCDAIILGRLQLESLLNLYIGNLNR